MDQSSGQGRSGPPILLKALIFLMFAMFAMTTDSVGTVIPEIIREFSLGLTAAGSFQYATMAGIGISAIVLGFLADTIGRKRSILFGLLLFGASCALFAAGHSFLSFVFLLFLSGLGIGIFKAGALALIGDISRSTHEHATTMNLVEGFFGIGAIIGPAIVASFLQMGMSWKWVYLIAAGLCLFLLLATLMAKFPAPARRNVESVDQAANTRETIRLMGDPAAMFFATALMLYVGAEAAIYVWAPTYLASYAGDNAWLAIYAVSVFFALRAAGRFLGVWLLSRFDWTFVLLCCTFAVALLFWIAVVGGQELAIYALPVTGLFMSVQYPTINSTGISSFERGRHGSIAGLLLFFTCLSAVLAPLAMAIIGDRLGDSRHSMALGAVFATALLILCVWNWSRQPFATRLAERNRDDYGAPEDSGPAFTEG